jgi:RimJ/RimL family protein N-acetyltransferase
MLALDQTLLLRPDAGPATGLTHVNRCVRLAKAWQKLGGTATFVCSDLPGSLERELAANQIRVRTLAHPDRSTQDARQTSEIASRCKPSWVVVDGPGFDKQYVEQIQNLARSSRLNIKFGVVSESSGAIARYDRAIYPLISPAGSSQSERGDAFSGTFATESMRYIPTECLNDSGHSNDQVDVPRYARKILFWWGEDVPSSETLSALHQLIDSVRQQTSIDVVLKKSQWDDASILKLRKENPQVTLRFCQSAERRLGSMAPIHLAIIDEDASKARYLATKAIPIAQVMCQTKTSISAKPNVAGVISIPSPCSGKSEFRRAMRKLIGDRHQRQALSEAGRANVDPDAASRVARRLASDALIVNKARSSDWEDVRRWALDPESQALTLSEVAQSETDRTSIAEEARFSESLEHGDDRWIFRRTDGGAVGYVSLDRDSHSTGDVVRANVLIDPAFRNCGFGTAVLERSIESCSHDKMIEKVMVQIKQGNRAAQQMARRAGMVQVDPTVVRGRLALQYAINIRPSCTNVLAPALRRSA